LFVLTFMTMFGVMFATFASLPVKGSEPPPPPPAFFLIFALFFITIYGVFLFPSFIAGYALLKRKRWAKVAAIIAAVVSSMFAPFGTAVSVYTFWFLFSEPGKLLYDTPPQALPPPSLFGVAPEASEQREFQPAAQQKPPDWR
jgi:hypothetical protein